MDEFMLETSIRNRIFDFLATSVQTHGEVLPWKILSHGFEYNGERVPLIGASGIWKPKALSLYPISISTAPPKPGRPAPYADGLDDDGGLSYCYRGTDPQHPHNVMLRAALHRSIPLVYFFGISKGQYLATWPVYIVDDDPSSLRFLVSVDDRVIMSKDDIDAELSVVREARRSYVTGIAIRRLHQEAFRIRVLRAYRDCCAVCRLKHTELLDAAHIIPDSDPRGEPIVTNGLALCKIHHAAFDKHILGIRPDYVVELRPDILEEIDGPMLRYGLQEMDGQHLHLPVRRADRPDVEFVKSRYEAFLKAV